MSRSISVGIPALSLLILSYVALSVAQSDGIERIDCSDNAETTADLNACNRGRNVTGRPAN